jgi:ferrous iron transport protein B
MADVLTAPLRIALVGNPNSGKTSLFNRLTGSRHKVANYAGVTVERRIGRMRLPSGREVDIIDLPGAYSLNPVSPDERITRDHCLGNLAGELPPDVLVCVADATNLRLHLRFALELKALGRPMVLALNQVDAARKRGIRIDVERLSAELGVPVVETIGIRNDGAETLRARLEQRVQPAPRTVPADVHGEVRRLLSVAVSAPASGGAVEDAIDRVVLHPVFGLALLAVLMFMIFQAVYAWAGPFQDLLEAGLALMADPILSVVPEGPLHSLLADGIFAGLGSVFVFLPQIVLLFLFILLLEESGYLPRAAFLLDRSMAMAGLSGRAFIPLLSSFACAIPGIMATRSIPHPGERLATIMVAPLMTCSARLPVYALLIAAFIPEQQVAGVFNLQGIVLFGLYIAGIISALAVTAFLKRRGADKGERPLLLELPAYRIPRLRDVAVGLWERAWIFLRRVGTIILALTVLLWFLASYPAPPEGAEVSAIHYSLAGRIGQWLQPVFAPLGFGWEICIALIPGLAAREVAVSSLATVYALSNGGGDDGASALLPLIASQWSLATGLSLLVWYIYAPMCLSTLAVIRRETQSWKQVAIATGYLFGLAYLASLVTYQLARLLS